MLCSYRGEKHSNDALRVEETSFVDVFYQQDTPTEPLPARVELGNMDLEEQERSPKWEKLILEGGQLQENKIRRENGKQLSGKHCMHFCSCRQLLQEHLVSFSVSKARAFS